MPPTSPEAALLVAGILTLSPTPDRPEATLEIGHTWAGEAIAPEERVTIRLALDADGEPPVLRIAVEAPFHDDPPPPGPPRSLDGLWRFEVAELFIAGASTPGDGPAYTEIELSPHGHYLVLRLAGVRRVVEKGLAIELRTTIRGGRWSALAAVPLAYLPPRPWTANAYALHGTGADRRYLAMIPAPGDAPDFHRPELFQPLKLESQ